MIESTCDDGQPWKLADSRPVSHLLLAALWSETMIGALVIGAAVGLAVLAFHPSNRGTAGEQLDIPGSGITIRGELVDVWMPESLLELVRADSAIPGPLDREKSRLQLNRERGGTLWYALTHRLDQRNGQATQITTIRYPCRPPLDFETFCELVEQIRISRSQHERSNVSTPAVHIIPKLLQLDPIEAAKRASRLSTNCLV